MPEILISVGSSVPVHNDETSERIELDSYKPAA